MSNPGRSPSGPNQSTGSTRTTTLGRRKYLLEAGAAVASITGLSGCTGAPGSAQSNESVTILLTPDNPSDVRETYMPVQNYLEGEIDGLEVEFQVPQDYSAIRPALESEQAEIGMDDITLISNPELMDVYGTAVTGGSAFYFSMMLSDEGSEIENPRDLQGKHVAFADKLSTSGSIFAVYTLKQAGLDVGDAPQGQPKDFEGTWSNHKHAVEMLANEEADAACTWTGNGMMHIERSTIPNRVAKKDAYTSDAATEKPIFKPFWWSFPIPKQPVYARNTWKSDMKGKIGQALLDASEEQLREYQPEDYDGTMPFTTLRETSIEAYQPVIKRLNDLGIELG